MGRVSLFEYDALNRSSATIDAAGGMTQQGYDRWSHEVSLQDPRALQTTYVYNALGDRVRQTSPDSGLTSFEYDDAGNLSGRTDARGAEIEYSYDALGRVTEIDYPDQSVTLGYDAGAQGRGRLTSMSDDVGLDSVDL